MSKGRFYCYQHQKTDRTNDLFIACLLRSVYLIRLFMHTTSLNLPEQRGVTVIPTLLRTKLESREVKEGVQGL